MKRKSGDTRPVVNGNNISAQFEWKNLSEARNIPGQYLSRLQRKHPLLRKVGFLYEFRIENDTHRKFNLPPIAAEPLHAVSFGLSPFFPYFLVHTHPVWNIRATLARPIPENRM